METANWLINVFVVIVVSLVYLREYLLGNGGLLKRPERAAVRVVDPDIIQARMGRVHH